jgi:hypothetical protein
MAVSSKNMAFRRDRASELRQIADLLDKHIGDANTYCIHNAIALLQNSEIIPVLKDGSTDENIWGYDIVDFELPVETIKHIKPDDIKDAKAILNLKLRADIRKWNTFEDPLIELSFDVTLKGIGKSVYFFGFHIDKHTSTTHSDEPHPIYHLQYNLNPRKSEKPNLGEIFYIDTPRIMHKPLDFILGIGFLTSNFYPTAYNVLIEDANYIKLSKKYQTSVWKPYFHTLANHWKPFVEGNITWKPTSLICPIFQ